MSKRNYISFGMVAFFISFYSCKSTVKEENETANTKTPVETEILRSVPMDEIIELPAVSAYLKKETVRSFSSGFITSVKKSLGDKVQAGDLLMIIKTKEASALKSIPSDSSLNISGLIQVKASVDGLVSQMDHHPGDFVSEGDLLITLAQPGSLAFYLKVPYSEHTALQIGQNYNLLMPDGKKISGKLTRLLTSVDAGSQSQDYLIEPISVELVPENLWVKVPVKVLHHQGNYSLPKLCIQSNETQTEFWVMKLSNDSLAIKVPVTRGIENDSLTEILAPVFLNADRFVGKGSYGLPDTARIEIKKENK
jgi:biotin carboxyl carrier protein